jgi:hypothetical protein
MQLFISIYIQGHFNANDDALTESEYPSHIILKDYIMPDSISNIRGSANVDLFQRT